MLIRGVGLVFMRMPPKKSISRILLKTLAISGMILVSASSPYFGLNMVKNIRKELKRKKWRQFYSDLYRLRRQNKIQTSQNSDGSYSVELTVAGKRIAERVILDEIKIKQPEKWDGHWRFFSFDIPAEKKFARQALLSKLKELNFVMVQKSLWAYPFECQKELTVIAKAFEVEKFVLYFVSHKVDKEAWLRDKFTWQSSQFI